MVNRINPAIGNNEIPSGWHLDSTSMYVNLENNDP